MYYSRSVKNSEFNRLPLLPLEIDLMSKNFISSRLVIMLRTHIGGLDLNVSKRAHLERCMNGSASKYNVRQDAIPS